MLSMGHLSQPVASHQQAKCSRLMVPASKTPSIGPLGNVERRHAWVMTDGVAPERRFVLEDSRPFDLDAGRMLTSTVEFGVGATATKPAPGWSSAGRWGIRTPRAGCRSWCADARSSRTATYRAWGHGRNGVPRFRHGGAEPDPVALPRVGSGGHGRRSRAAVVGAGRRRAGIRLRVRRGHAAGGGFGLGLNAFRGRSTMTLILGTRSGAGGRDLRLGVGWALGEALHFGVEATRGGSASDSADHEVRLSATSRSSIPTSQRSTTGWSRCGRTSSAVGRGRGCWPSRAAGAVCARGEPRPARHRGAQRQRDDGPRRGGVRRAGGLWRNAPSLPLRRSEAADGALRGLSPGGGMR